MNYKNGREAHEGDPVIHKDRHATRVDSGTLCDLTPEAGSGNILRGYGYPIGPVPVAECYHAQDALNAIEASITPQDAVGTPTKSEAYFEELAGRMYTAYCKSVGGRAFNGDPLPNWTEFRSDNTKRVQSEGWVAAAKATQ